MFNFKSVLLILFGGLTLMAPGCFIDLDFDDDDDVFGCERGRGGTVVERLDLDAFHSIVLANDADVFLRQGPIQEVEVEAQSNIIDLLETRVRNGEWVIGYEDCVRDHDRVRIYITLPDIRELTLSGSGDIYGENIFYLGDVSVRITGSGDVDLEMEADDLDLLISGSGDLALSGLCDGQRTTISGSGDLQAFNLDSRTANIRISGSGDAEVFVTQFLDVLITGSGNVYYKGDPDIDVTITGSGRLIDTN